MLEVAELSGIQNRSSTPLHNGAIAELLAQAAEDAVGHMRQALLRASRAAYLWPVEAFTLLDEGRSLEELRGIGPSLAKKIRAWIENPPALDSSPSPLRQEFLTMCQARPVLESNPQFRNKLRGDLQMHTNYSDGENTVLAMAEAGIARNYSYISITDHAQGLKIANGMSPGRLEMQSKEIDQVNQQLEDEGIRFKVLKSIELNLNTSGEGDMGGLSTLDLVLGSFHSALRKSEDQTERYLAAIRNPDLDILGHPRGRVYNYRLGLQADWRAVFAEAARLDKAVEIDSYVDRQDLNLSLLKIAKEEGVRISLGSDAHHDWQLEFLDLGLAAAILAQIPPDRILNFMTAKELVKWAHQN